MAIENDFNGFDEDENLLSKGLEKKSIKKKEEKKVSDKVKILSDKNWSYRKNSYSFLGDTVANIVEYDKNGSHIIETFDGAANPNAGKVVEQIVDESVIKGNDNVVIPIGAKNLVENNSNLSIESENKESIKVKKKQGLTKNKDELFIAGLALNNDRNQGVSNEETIERLKKSGYTETDINKATDYGSAINKALGAGHSLEAIKEKFTALPTKSNSESPEWDESDGDLPKDLTVKDLVASAKRVYTEQKSIFLTSFPGLLGNTAAKARIDKAKLNQQNEIIRIGRDAGLDLKPGPGGTWRILKDGQWFNATPGLMKELSRSSGEFTLALGGTYAGAQLGGAAAQAAGKIGPLALLPEEVVTVPLAMWGGAVLGGVGGSMVGSSLDYLREAMLLNEKINAEQLAYTNLNAGELAVLGEAAGWTLMKIAGSDVLQKFIEGAKNRGVQGGYNYLKEHFFLTDEQANEIVKKAENLGLFFEGSEKQKAIGAVVTTQTKGAGIIKTVSMLEPKVLNQAAKAAIKRSNEAIKSTKIDSYEVAKTFMDDINNYKWDVKNNYSKVVESIESLGNGKKAKWHMEEMAIDPVLIKIAERINDPAFKIRFVNKMELINNLTKQRDLPNLLLLRQEVNDLLFNKNITNYDDVGALRGVIKEIDDQIEYTAERTLNKSNKWIKDWKEAKKMYSEMKKLEKNAIYKTIFDDKGNIRAIDSDKLVTLLDKHITSIDGSYNEVISKLPIKGRALIDNAVLSQRVKKYSIGSSDGERLVHFPILMEELNQITFTTKKAREDKAILNELGKVFKNDVVLGAATEIITIPKFQSYLTVDPWVRLQFEIASGVWNWIKRQAAGPQYAQMQMVKQVTKLLKNPLDSKSFEEIRKSLPPDLMNKTRELQKIQAEKNSKLPKSVKKSKEIPDDKIASYQSIKNIAEELGVDPNAKDNKKFIRYILKERGFKAMQTGSGNKIIKLD